MPASTSRAFSLIEILLVTAVIAILVSLLLPVLGRVRESAYAATCAANLRQIGYGTMLYAQDQRGMLPPTQDPSGGAGDLTFFARIMPWTVDHYTGDSWAPGSSSAAQILDQSRIFSCRKAAFNREEILALGAAYLNRMLNSSYGVNQRLDSALHNGVMYRNDGTLMTSGEMVGPDVTVGGAAVRRRVASASGADRIILITEGWAVGTAAGQPSPQRILYVSPPYHNNGSPVYGVPAWIPPRTIPALIGAMTGDGFTRSQASLRQSHPGRKANVLFLDGHIKALRDIDTFFNGFGADSKPVNMWRGIQ